MALINTNVKINTPDIHSVVFYQKSNRISGEETQKSYPVLILSGQYLDSIYKRVSNFWKWQKINDDGSLGEIENGYGNFLKAEGYEVKHEVLF